MTPEQEITLLESISTLVKEVQENRIEINKLIKKVGQLEDANKARGFPFSKK